MNYETTLALALRSPPRSERVLSTFLKMAEKLPTPSPKPKPLPSLAIRGMKRAVKNMAQVVRGKPKLSSPKGLIDQADAFGRQLAHEDFERTAQVLQMAPMRMQKLSGASLLRAQMEKQAINWQGLAQGVGRAFTSGAAKYGPSINKGLQTAKGWSAIDPIKRGLTGAGIGAGIGAVRHYMKPRDPNTGQRAGSLVGSMVGHGALGAGAGLATPHAASLALETEPIKRLGRGEVPWQRKAASARQLLGQ